MNLFTLDQMVEQLHTAGQFSCADLIESLRDDLLSHYKDGWDRYLALQGLRLRYIDLNEPAQCRVRNALTYYTSARRA